HGRMNGLACQGEAPAGHATPIRTLEGATPAQLVAALRSDNMFWRLHAQRLLVERGKDDVVPALVELVQDQNVDSVGLNPAAIHALWTLHALGALEGSEPAAVAAAAKSCQHKSVGVRRNAVQLLPLDSDANRSLVE